MALTKAHARMIDGAAASVVDFGADITGVADSTSAVQAALDTGNNIFFPKGTYKVTNVTVNNACIIDLQGSTIIGESGSNNFCFNVEADHVTLKDGFFGSGSESCGIVQVGNSTTFPQYKNFNLFNVYSDLAITNDKGCCALLNAIQPVVRDCTFIHSGGANTDNMAVRISYPVSSLSSNRLDVQITDNHFDGYEYGSRCYGSGFFSGLTFANNTILNAGRGFSSYHAHNTIFADNLIVNNSAFTYLWQRTNATGNTWTGSTGDAAVKIETNAGIFTNNIIRSPDNIGVIIDGGPSPMLFANNRIETAGTHGIYINPAYSYGGQTNSLRIEDNFVYGAYGHCLWLDADQNIRSLYIKGNHFLGAGEGNASAQYTVYLDFKTFFADRIVIKDNILAESDVVYNVQGNSDHGFYIDSDNENISYWVEGNWIDLATYLYDTRTAGGGVRMVLRNLVQDVAGITANRGSGAIAGNYDLNGGTSPDAAS